MLKIILSVIVLFLSGCMSYSEYPISTHDDKQDLDNVLFGTWYFKNKRKIGYLHIGIERKTHLLKLIMVEIKKSAKMSVMEFEGYSSKLNGKTYLNIKWKTPKDDESKGYIFIKYNLVDDGKKLGLAFANPDVYRKSIKKKSLKGTPISSEWSTSVKITDNSENIRRYIDKNSDKLFPEIIYLKRLVPAKYEER